MVMRFDVYLGETTMLKLKSVCCIIAMMCFSISPTMAHVTDIVHQHGFAAGAMHPLAGLDHILGMMAIGLWAGYVGGNARWAWPLAFVGFAGFGALAGYAGVEIQALEILVAASVVTLGFLLFAGMQISALSGALISGAAGFVHGYAHGVEMPSDVGVALFFAGFLLATALLHGVGLLVSPQLNGYLRQLAGGFVAACGSYLLLLAF